MTTEKKKVDMLYVHIAVMLALIIGFHFVPTVGSITPVGMKLVGIFWQCYMDGLPVVCYGPVY